MYLSRAASGDGVGLLWALGALVLYLLISYGLQYRAGPARLRAARP